MTALPLEQLAEYVEQAPAIPVDRDRAEVRIYATIVAGASCWSLVQPAFYILQTDSPLARVCLLTGAPWLIATIFLTAAAALLPHLFTLVFAPKKLYGVMPRKIAAAAMWVAAALWAYLANKANPLDMGHIAATYWVSSAGYLLVGGALGYSLNAQQALQKLADEIASQVG